MAEPDEELPRPDGLTRRPSTRAGFEVAFICALPLEADAVSALFDIAWDSRDYGKTPGDPNAYSTGMFGRYAAVLVHMPDMGKVNAAKAAENCRSSFPNIRLAIVVGICGGVPFPNSSQAVLGATEVILGDVIISDKVIQYDLGRQLPEQFLPKSSLSGSPPEIRTFLARLKTRNERRRLQEQMVRYLRVIQQRQDLEAAYPGASKDNLFDAAYRHLIDGKHCGDCGCNGPILRRTRLTRGSEPVGLAVHIGPIASGDRVMKSGEDRDRIAGQEGILGFEMEGAGVWDTFPCVVVKGVCDYADSHKTKAWQRYAAATAAACAKAVLDGWVMAESPAGVTTEQAIRYFVVPYPENGTFVGRAAVLERLRKLPLESDSQTRASLYGLGGVGKTQIALAHAYWLKREHPEVSVFWVHASNADRFLQSYAAVAEECCIPGRDDPKVDLLHLVKSWLERKETGTWFMTVDNADDKGKDFYQHIPTCSHGLVLITTRSKAVALNLGNAKSSINVKEMGTGESVQLIRQRLPDDQCLNDDDLSTLASHLEHLPLALAHAAAYIAENSISISKYLKLLGEGNQNLIELLSKDLDAQGGSQENLRVVDTWILSFEQIRTQNRLAADLLSLMSYFDRQAIPEKFLLSYAERFWKSLTEYGNDPTKATSARDSLGGGGPGRGSEENRKAGRKKPRGIIKAFALNSFQAILQGSRATPSESKTSPATDTPALNTTGRDEEGEMAFQEALGILKAFSLITPSTDDSFNMHRLVKLVTQGWLERKNMARHFEEQALLTVSYNYPFGQYEDWAVCTAYLPHADAVRALQGTRSDEVELEKARLLGSLANFWRHQGRWKEAEELEVQALDARRRVLGREHPDTLASMNNLANTYQDQGRWKEAEELQVQALEARRRVLGREHPDTLRSMNNLANTYQDQGRWKEAEELRVQVLEARRRVLGREHPDTLRSTDNLAITYQAQGRWKEAEELQVQALEARRRVLGREHPSTLTSMNNLARSWMALGRTKEAVDLMHDCVKLRREALGADHPDTVQSASWLQRWRGEP